MKTQLQFPELLQTFFTDRLIHQRQASSHTIASYRDTFRLLLHFAQQQIGRPPTKLTMEDLDPRFLGVFLHYLEKDRGICARSRNVRLAAIHSFFRFVALNEPAYSALAQRVLAIPSKRFDRRPIEYLTRPEVEGLLAAPDRATWGGRRDYTLLLTAAQTGLRVSELIGLRCEDVTLGAGGSVRCRGKGRKERSTPLRKDLVAALRAWLRERAGGPTDYLFPNARGGPLSRDGVEYLLAKHVTRARKQCASLTKKHISMHVLRHSVAMDLLQHGVDRSVIALWLGHESVETTQMYLHADMMMKEEALAKTAPHKMLRGRYRPHDHLLTFLKSL
ncbi:MAG: site-specific integrase [Terriglobia bacterium]